MNPSDTTQAALNGGGAANSSDSQFRQLMAQAQGETADSGPPALSGAPTISGLLRALRRRWLTALGAGAVVAACAVFAVFQFMPPKYFVTIRIRIAAKQGTDDAEFPIYKASMESLIKSPLVINAALNEKLADGREVRDLDIVRAKGSGAVDWLEKGLKTDFVLGPEILRATLAADQPDEAADLLNAIARAFRNECAEADRSKRQQRLADLNAKKDRIVEDLRLLRITLYEKMAEFKVRDNDAASIERQQWLQKLVAAENFRRNNDEEIGKAEAELISLEAKLANVPNYRVPEDFREEANARNPIIDGYQKRLTKLDQDIYDYNQKYNEPFLSERTLPLKREKAQISLKLKEQETLVLPDIEKRFRAKVKEEIEYQTAIAKDKRDGHKHRSENLAKDVQTLERKLKELGQAPNNKPAAIVTLEEKIEVARSSLNQAAQRIGEEELAIPGSRIRWEGPATPPTDRDVSRQTKVAGAGGLGIFCLMVLGVAMLEFRSRKISVADDVSHGLGLNVVGTVPVMPTQARKDAKGGAVQEQLWQNQLHESIDAIRTVVLHSARGEVLQVIMVTSANSGEGKTTLATQLAASLARAWKRTLIIDGDLRHPTAHQLFDVPQEPGLAEVLRGEVEIADAIRATTFSRLWVLSAGNGDSHAIQALAQESVGAIFGALKQQYDFIVIDTPPVLPVTDALLLGQHADGVLLSILRDVSRAPAVHAAQQKLAPLGVRTLGAVILGTETEHSDKHYRYAVSSAK